MDTDLDTLLIDLYVLVDDHVILPQHRRPGRAKRLSDAELVCLAVAQVPLGARSEHRWLRLCYARLGHLFGYLPKQPGYHKRLTAAAPLICKTIRRAWPSRRACIPKADGRSRPLGIAVLEDKIVQRAVVEVLGAICAVDLRGLSYGFGRDAAGIRRWTRSRPGSTG